MYSAEDVSPGVESIASVGEEGIESPKLSSTRELEKSAERSRRQAGTSSEPHVVDLVEAEVPFDFDKPEPWPEDEPEDGLPAPLQPGMVIVGQSGNSLQHNILGPLSPTSIICGGSTDLLEAKAQGDFNAMDTASRNILFGVSTATYYTL